MRPNHSILLLLALCLILILAACASATTVPTQTPIPPTVTRRPTLTASPVPTETPTPTLSPTPQPSETAMPTSTPSSELNGAKFFTSGFLPGFRYFIAVQAPQAIQGKYEMIVHEDKTYPCEVNSQYPERLYCTGPLARVDDWVNYRIIDKSSQQTVFSGKIFIPLVIPP